MRADGDLDAEGEPDAVPATAEECVPYPVLSGYAFVVKRGSAAETVARELDAAREAEADAKARIVLAKARLVHLSGGAEQIRLPGGGGYIRRVEDREYAAQPVRWIAREVIERVDKFPPPQRR